MSISMRTHKRQPVRTGLVVLATIWMLVVVPLAAAAAPYAAIVMDARTGEVLHARNADTRLNPASLTKMMTLYIAFEAVENGEISLDTYVTISKLAASEPPSNLGLKAGQKIKLRYLIRAAAVKSANDAATAIAEAISGSEAKFARRMNRTAKAMGMSRTTFKNAHGLTERGHLSTARDMTILGRQLFYDYPDYYNLFSRVRVNAGGKTIYHTNRRLLSSYSGADGIKTGYTRASGFNLVASAERGGERIIATVFGGRSSRSRDAKVAELLDLGFRRAPTRVAVNKPSKPAYIGNKSGDTPGGVGKTVRLASAAAVKKSLRPQMRPGAKPALIEEPALIAEAAKDSIEQALLEAQAVEVAELPMAQPTRPEARSETERQRIQTRNRTELAEVTPEARPEGLVLASISDAAVSEPEPEQQVVTRLSTSGGREWGINVGRFPSRYKARKVLLTTALNEMATLDGSLRKVIERRNGYDANFMGLTRETADLACRRLQAKKMTCFMIGPG